MKITRESNNHRAKYRIDGVPIRYGELERRFARILTWEGLMLMFDSLVYKGECTIDIDDSKTYLPSLNNSNELAAANGKIAALEKKLAAFKNAYLQAQTA